jgi:hypothetical protein
VDHIRVKAGVLLGALVAGALTAGTLTGVPTANATCASFFGIGNSAQCTSNPTSIAIAIGTNAVAHADGLFGAAFSVGTAATASTGDAFTFATAIGDKSTASGHGLFAIATQLGPNGYTRTEGSGSLGNLGLNIALNVSPGTTAPNGSYVFAVGIGNVAVNLFGNGTAPLNHQVVAAGTINIATDLGGTDNAVLVNQPGGALNLAFDTFGSGNTVRAGPGPLAIAGSIGQNGQTIIKVGPGFNINGLVVRGAAAVRGTEAPAPTATAVHTGKTTAARAASTRGGTKRTAASAASVAGKK